jgi:hypothetical protein
MARRVILRLTRLGALALIAKVRNRLGLPRCHCPTHAVANGGRYLAGRATARAASACTCTAASGVGVDPLCPFVTKVHVRFKKHPSLSIWYVGPFDAVAESVIDPDELLELIDEPAAVADVAEEDE